MKKIAIFLGAMALVAAMSTVAVAEQEDLCQQRKAVLLDVSPKKDIVYSIKDCTPAKPEASQSQSKKSM